MSYIVRLDEGALCVIARAVAPCGVEHARQRKAQPQQNFSAKRPFSDGDRLAYGAAFVAYFLAVKFVGRHPLAAPPFLLSSKFMPTLRGGYFFGLVLFADSLCWRRKTLGSQRSRFLTISSKMPGTSSVEDVLPMPLKYRPNVPKKLPMFATR